MSLFDDVKGLVRAVRIQTAWTPDIVLEKPFEKSEPSFVMTLLKPRIVLETGGKPIIIEPYGNPGESNFPFLLLGVVFIATLFFLLRR